MTYVTRVLVLLLVGLFMMSASASADDRLTISGSMNNHVFGVSNFSGFDNNFTSLTLSDAPQPGDQDDFVIGASRIWVNLTVEAFENTSFYFSTLTDQFWGVKDQGEYDYSDGSAWYADSYNPNAIRFKSAYVDFLIPGAAASMRLGGFDSNAQRLKGCTFYCVDTAGIGLTAPFSDMVNTYTWYGQWSDEWDGFGAAGAGAPGESWAAGTRIEFAPMVGLDLDLIYVYQRLDCAGAKSNSCPGQTLQLRRGEGANTVSQEHRNWAGIDMRYQYGDFTLAPTLILHFGSTDLVGGGESDISSFLLDIEASYQMGPLQLRGRVAYSPGNPASDALGDGSTLNSWQAMTWYTQPSVSWFMLWSPRQLEIYPSIFNYSSGRSLDTRMSFDQFGSMVVAVRADYALNERTSINGTLGIINAAEDVGRPARLGARSTDKKASIALDATEADGLKETAASVVPNKPDFNYTGNDTHIATEVNVELAYVLNPSTTLRLWAAYSINGAALDLQEVDANGTLTGRTAESEDTVGAGARVVYSF